MRAAIASAPRRPVFHANLANMLADQGAFDEALEEYSFAISLDPTRPEFHHNLGLLYYRLRKYPSAIDCFDRALVLHPHRLLSVRGRALALLASGDLAGGFAGYDVRFDVDAPGCAPDVQLRSVRQMRIPLWMGEDLTGRTLWVYAEQGLGDTLQFIRFLPLAARRGARIIFDSQAELVRLLQGFPGVAELRREGGRFPSADFQVPLLSLPHRLGIR